MSYEYPPWFSREKMREGALCKYGHDDGPTGGSLRYKSDRGCVPCKALRSRQWKLDNADKQLASKRKHRDKHRDRINREAREWRASNPEKAREKDRRDREVAGRDKLRAKARASYHWRKVLRQA